MGNFFSDTVIENLTNFIVTFPYRVLFKMCESIQRSILKKLLHLTCDRSTQNLTNIALELLRDLQRKYRAEIQNWGTLLMVDKPENLVI